MKATLDDFKRYADVARRWELSLSYVFFEMEMDGYELTASEVADFVMSTNPILSQLRETTEASATEFYTSKVEAT